VSDWNFEASKIESSEPEEPETLSIGSTISVDYSHAKSTSVSECLEKVTLKPSEMR
jgi:hypothetical protein